MKKFFIQNLSISVMTIFLLSGCGGILYPGSKGNERIKDDSYISQIVPQKTNMQNVRSLLGKPERVTKSSNGEVTWSYQYFKYWMGSYSAQIAEVTFYKNGVVKDYKYSNQ